MVKRASASAQFEQSEHHGAVDGVITLIDYITALLLLTGQITTTGVFLLPEGLSLSCTGPIVGSNRLEGSQAWSKTVLDGIDIVLAVSFILGEVSVTGPYVAFRSLYIVVTGQPSHAQKRRAKKTATYRQHVYQQLRSELRRVMFDENLLDERRD